MKRRLQVTGWAIVLLAVALLAGAAVAAASRANGPAVSPGPDAAPPGIYVFYDWTRLDPARYPIVGGHMVLQWDQVETAPRSYDWSEAERWISNYAAQGKVAGLQINSYDGQCCGGLRIPAYLIQAHPETVITCPGNIKLPRYWDPNYQGAFRSLIRAFGARYNGDPRIAWIEVSAGVFGETAPAESQYNACLEAAGLTSEMWVDFVNWSVDVYREAFPDTQLLLQYAPRYLYRWERKEFTDYAAGLGVGLKHNGLKPDQDGDAYIDYPDSLLHLAGQYDPLARWGEHVATAFEGTESGFMGGRTNTLWGIYNALDKHVDYLNLDTAVVSAADRQDILQFAANYLGRTLADTPSVWVALRETEGTWYPDYGNFEFWLYQNDAVPGGRTVPRANVGSAAEGRFTRRTDQASGNDSMYFDIDDRYVYGGVNRATVTITYYDQGADRWELRYDSVTENDKLAGAVRKQNTLTWRKATFELTDARFANGLPGGGGRSGSDFRIWCAQDGNETIHFVDVKIHPSNVQTRVLQPGQDGYAGLADTFLDRWAPSTNYGADQRILIFSRDNKHGLLKFDLTGLPPNAQIVSAVLEVYQYGRQGDASLRLAAHRMLRPWDEHAATWQMATATDAWQAPGANGLLDRARFATAATNLDQSSGWASLDVTPLAQQWLSSPASNYGVLLAGHVEASVEYRFASSLWPDAQRRPRLTITYTNSPRPTRVPTQTPTALPSATPADTATPTPSPTITWTPIATHTVTPSSTATASPVPTETATAAATPTGTPTATVTATVTPEPTGTATSTATPTATPTPSPTATATRTPTPVPPGRIVAGTWLDGNLNGRWDPGEAPVVGMPFLLHRNAGTIQKPEPGELLRQGPSGADGKFVFAGVPLGSYVVVIPQPPDMRLTTPGLVAVALSEAEPAANAFFGVTWSRSMIYLPWIIAP